MASVAILYSRRLATRTLGSSASASGTFSRLLPSRYSTYHHPSDTAIPASLTEFPSYSNRFHPSFPPPPSTPPPPPPPPNPCCQIDPYSSNHLKCRYAFSSIGIRHLSSVSGDSNPPIPSKNDHQPTIESFKHQEIEGPTVERDVSPLANETREVLDKLRTNVYNLSNAVALLGMAQLLCGAWITWLTRDGGLPEASVQGFASFAFPFTMAFLLRQAAKPMGFFRKMEEMGRLQILTLNLQVAKSVDQLVRRIQVISIFCGAGILIGLLLAAWSH